ncbi:sn-glycerol-3-phosphate ABC transporter substrate-binding protein UgpB [Sabulicella glaciei]|uniref:sn-glycerol-3-phosphate-binding periplasmic protein UgpB n=1 Tax=Sabulicella glaciei TaxID=2984948 RepID=A0ABT3NXW3_9PROT|nr:sn-glycerol-3-phosphate ABC transporter substrate-binding protein UgpB [Roseococcus sp. MDT2-1-1]MCW8086409.1 sn-glycerol-3-phosphate ABC transporter substrate-binding protein UgpB [Roseococcus sp. MDT2-1-1]
MLRRRQLGLAAAGTLAPVALAAPALAQGGPTEIQFWHGLAQPLGGLLEAIANDFNNSQNRARVVSTFRGGYPETMVAAIAAFRAGTAPHIVQMFEVGTGTMMAAGRAIKPLHELLRETNVNINFDDYLPAVRGYYSLADGRMMSMPFNSSTAIMFYNKDAFRRAGLNPDEAPKTWAEVRQAAQRIKAAGHEMPFTTAWPTWTQIEQQSAIHNQEIASQENGFGGLNTELRVNNPLMQRHFTNLLEMGREGTFRWGGRDSAGDALFASGQAAIVHASSGARARFVREVPGGVANIGAAMLPYYEDVPGAPINSIIGGASFWAMNRGPNAQRSADENRAIAEFFAFLARPEVAAKWHTDTGFLPVTRSAYERVRQSGFYEQNPGADIPIQQLLRGDRMTGASRGIRLGGFVEIRVIMQEEMERALQGQQAAPQALQNMTTRGNAVLRNFERTNRG